MTIKSEKCQYFPVCGGCKYLHLTDSDYQAQKSSDLKKLLHDSDIENIVNFNWVDPPNRRKIQLHVNNDNALGFYQSNSKNIIKIDKCYVAENEINEIILPLQLLIKSIRSGAISKIQITNFDNSLDLLFFLKKDLNIIEQQKIIEFCKSYQVNAGNIYQGQLTNICQISKNIISANGFDLELQGDIFLQASRLGLEKIIQIINGFIDSNFKTKISVADLYSGFGLYGFSILKNVKKLDLYEGSAVMNALVEENLKKNIISAAVNFNQRDLFNFPLSSGELKLFDLAIINPPRNGASMQAREIANSKLKNLIYVSCNPKTFIRDYKILQQSGFVIDSINAIDQFYSTDHFELVTILTR